MKHSRLSLLICMLAILYTGLIYYPKWEKQGTEATISWDVSGYYMYLPALFIYKDAKKCSFQHSIIQKYCPTPDFQQAFQHASGNYVMKYSSGQAILMMPFFLTGHLFGKISSYPADGFSYPYQLAIGLGMLVYAFIGLWYLRKILLTYFSDSVTAITIAAIVLASNYFNYAAIDGAMTHNTLFTIYCVLLYTTIRFTQQPSFLKAIAIGSLCGLAALIRPTEVITVLIAVLWGIQNFKELKERLVANWRYYTLMAFAFCVVISIQPLYWKWATGEWIVYSYQDQGFNFLKPHLWKGIFDFRSGWLIYSPIFILVIPGFYYLYQQQKKIFPVVLLFSVLFIYICFSWDQWWYGGSLGARAMIQCYPVLAFALAAFVQNITEKKEWVKIGFAAFSSLCMYYNFWLTHQAHKGGLYKAGEMTGAYWKAVLFKQEANRKWDYLLDNNELYKMYPQNVTTVYTNNFETDTSALVTEIDSVNGKKLLLSKPDQYSTEFKFALKKPQQKWIRASADFTSVQKEWETWRMVQFCIRLYKNGKMVKHNYLRVHRLLNDNETKNIFIDMKAGNIDFDEARIYFWNPASDKPLIVDNLQVVTFDY
ncbi:hypothetical protein WG954_08520 [Lacibacter sp. H375]|uniref:hypothetical protein n=1 Tax=Lacibacter sp. H375 TaxID=3133424 RepID=UPI0030BFE6F4